MRIVFLHPDLGIGGAERLVVDAALALKSKNHDVHIVTAHHDVEHCFAETKNGEVSVTSYGDWLPRTIFKGMAAFCATMRMIYAAICLSLFSGLKPDVIICDQVSNAIPVLRLFSSAKIIFYCHFPDQLLTQRKTLLKRMYRKVMDSIEEFTTGLADLILVNSNFTGGVFRDTFKSLSCVNPDVLYPSLNTSKFDEIARKNSANSDPNCFTFLSLNRYERKKNIGLAIEAFDLLLKSSQLDMKLIVAGGYDNRVSENVEHYEELTKIAEDHGISSRVEFLRSPDDEEKVRLLRTSDCLLYTPSGEHFGIVPIEAMYHELPVIAVNDGGPTETVVDGETGYLRKPTSEDFAEAMESLVEGGTEQKSRMGKNGKRRVMQNFSFNAFADNLDNFVKKVFEI